VDDLPVLWHLKVSNYNEKARWALDYKRIAHRRRAAVAGRHEEVAKQLTGGSTLPVLVLDGEAIGDSTRIIEALERRSSDQPLYPGDPVDCRRALELEDFFDEHLGAHVRMLFIHHALPDARLMLGAFAPDLSGARLMAARLAFPPARRRIRSRFEIEPGTVVVAYEKIAEAGARFRAELQPSGYLVGDRFTVADLTLAALIAPVVAPPEFQYPQPQRGHPRLRPLRDALEREGMLDWARGMYAVHRGRSAEVLD
jgi:glutathione S-transferase